MLDIYDIDKLTKVSVLLDEVYSYNDGALPRKTMNKLETIINKLEKFIEENSEVQK